MSNCAEVEKLIAAYTFGALEPLEHDLVLSHLAGCPACRALHAQAAELPALLDLAGGTETQFASPPPLLEASVLASLPGGGAAEGRRQHSRGRQRRERGDGRGLVARRRYAALVAAAVVAAVVAFALLPRSSSSAPRFAFATSSLDPGAVAVATLRARAWGTEVDFSADHLAPTRGDEIYELWFVSSRGRVSAGTFTVGSHGHVSVVFACSARARQYTSIGVTIEPNGLDPSRQGPNVLHADLSRD